MGYPFRTRRRKSAIARLRPSLNAVVALAVALLATAAAGAQAPAPVTETRESARLDLARLAALGDELLEREDPVAALATFRLLLSSEPDDVAARIGLGRTELMLGRPERALAEALRAIAISPSDGEAIALQVRSLLRARRFTEALAVSTVALAEVGDDVGLLAAHASALFRLQRNDEAAAFYRRVIERNPDHAEAHLRLGSGLTAPRAVRIGVSAQRAIAALRADRLDRAIAELHRALREDAGNPVLHRLLGETLFLRRARASMACTASEFARVAEMLPSPQLDQSVALRFMPDLAALSGARRDVAVRTLGAFESFLATLVRKGGSHDLLSEHERTTDAPSRASLRGKRTFDGRVWDDVRGIGGLRAATGIEALDEAAVFGFDTLAHEIAHQVHLHGFAKRSLQVRIRELYEAALAEDRCLDYYAASNYAEYFGQGVEAFTSLVKRPTAEATHGHTRFELMRVDPRLHDLIAEIVDVDPLAADRDATARATLLDACVDAAIRAGRAGDARTAAQLMPPGPDRDAALARAAAASRQIEFGF